MNADDKIFNAAKEVYDFETIEINDIPNIDLYMDQVTTFIDTKLSCYKRNFDDKVLTKTMINNYAKGKLFPPPQKKKYTRSHIMLLIIIYHLKSILSINDIYLLLSPINTELSENSNSKMLENVYKNFLKMQKSVQSATLNSAVDFEEIKKIFEVGDHDIDKIENILYVLTLSFFANTEKRLAEKIIDNSFKNK